MDRLERFEKALQDILNEYDKFCFNMYSTRNNKRC